MADYSVKGIGTVTLPDGLSEAEIQSALDSHPDVMAHVKEKSPTKFGFDVITDRLKGKNTPIGDAPQNELKAIWSKIGEGLPIVGNYIPDSKESKDYQQQHPAISNMARAESAIASNMAASGGLGAVPALSRGVPWLASQTALGGLLGAGDKAAQEHSQGQPFNTSDILKAMTVGSGSTIAGAGASKFISPNMGIPPVKSYVPTPPKGTSYEDILARTRWNNPTNQRTQEQLAALINARREEMARAAFEAAPPHGATRHAINVAGTALGHGTGLGAMLTHLGTSFHQNVLKNQIMNNPQKAAMMQALMMSGGEGFNRLPDAQ